jgi:hypothetical protein
MVVPGGFKAAQVLNESYFVEHVRVPKRIRDNSR